MVTKWKVKIQGVQPLIWNVMKREIELEKKKLKKNELSEWEENNWKKKAEYNDKGKVVIPERWVKSSLIAACKYSRLVPSFATRKSETFTRYMQSMMVGDVSPAYDEKQLEYFGAYVGAQGKSSSGSKVWRVRPLMKEWIAEFLVIDPVGRMVKGELQALVGYAGLYCGIGDNRNNNFGRFVVKSIVEVK